MFLSPSLVLSDIRPGDNRSLFLTFLLLVLNEIGLPLPIVYESLLLYSGYELGQRNFSYLLLAVFGSLGSVVGASLLFVFFFFLGVPILQSRLLRGQVDKINALKGELLKREILAVTLGRLTPGLLGLTSAAAGILRLNYFKFIAGVLFSNVIWAGIMLAVGFFLGRAAARFENSGVLSGRTIFLVGTVSLLALWLLLKHILQALRKNYKSSRPPV